MVKFWINAAFGGYVLSYFDLIVKWCSVYLRSGAYDRKYSVTDDAQYSK